MFADLALSGLPDQFVRVAPGGHPVGRAHAVRSNYVVGDKVTIDVLRGDKRLSLPMQLR